jgi:hypothetical protein
MSRVNETLAEMGQKPSVSAGRATGGLGSVLLDRLDRLEANLLKQQHVVGDHQHFTASAETARLVGGLVQLVLGLSAA